jgi:two-component system, chemotaxis family, response regulator Rcp1
MTRRILLVEDNAGDAQLMRIAFAEALPDARLSVVSDGETAVRTLLGGGAPPDLVLLDLNLPRLSGHEVLASVRAAPDPAVRRVPVVVLSSSRAASEVERSYELGAASHIAKPHDMDELLAVAEAIARYWFATVTLP